MTKKDKTIRIGVGCWIENPMGDFLFGTRLSKHGNGTWAPPGGHMEFGETPEQCAARELAEETDILLAPNDFLIIGITNDIFPDKHYVTIHCHSKLNFLPNPKAKEPNKCAAWDWVNLNFIRNHNNLFLPAQNLLKQKVFGA